MKSGQLTPALSETLTQFDTDGTPRTTPEIAEDLGLGRRSTYDRLERLVDCDMLRTKKVGANARVWWRPPNDGIVTDGPEEIDASQKTAEEFHSLIEAVDEYAIFMLDTEGHVQTWNPGAARIKGYSRDEIVGEHFSTFYTAEDREAGVPKRNLAAATERGSIEDEGWRVRNDGSRFWANVTITAMHDDDGQITGYAKVTRDMTERREYERQLREEKAFSKSILDNQRDLIYAFDTDGQFLRWNQQFQTVTGYSDEEIRTMSPTDFIAPEDTQAVVDAIDSVFDGDTVTVEANLLTAAGETIPYEFSGTPLTNENGTVAGLTGIGRDITDRRATERRLQRQRDELRAELDDVFERIEDGFYALDSELRFTYLNDWAAELLDLEEASAIDRYVWDVIESGPREREAFERALECQEPTTLQQYYEPLESWFEVHVYPSQSGLSVYFRDISERKEREQELERFKRAVEASGHAIYMTDPDGYITFVNEEFERLTGYAESEVLDKRPSILHSGTHDDEYYRELWETISSGEVWEEEIVDRRKNGELYDAEQTIAPVFDDDGNVDRYVAVQKDVTERKERERELVRYETLFEESKDVNAVVDTDGTFEYITPSAANVFGYEPDELVGEVGFEYIHPEDRNEAIVEFGRMLDDPDHEPRIDFRFQHADGSWIVIEAVARNLLDEPDIEGIVIYTRDVTERQQREEKLLHQRERLSALNELNSIAREVTDAVIDQSTREDIEQIVCEHLAESDSYLFAWTGDADAETQTVSVRASAATGEYLEDLTISIDSEDERSHGPTGQALLTGELQTAQYIPTNSSHDPWHERIEEQSFRSSAAIPIVHDGTIYGVLNVYSGRPDAFEDEEAQMMAQLGDIVGHAIAAVARKQALMSNEVIEVGFQIENFLDTLGLERNLDCHITIDHTIQIDTDEYVIFGHASPESVDVLETLVATVDNYSRITYHDSGDRRRFELSVTTPPILSTVANLGGSVDTALLEDGDYRLTVHLPPSADVQKLMDTVMENYPTASLIRHRQLSKPDRSGHIREETLTTQLTDRQRVVLEAAYHAGFFEWPRNVSGEELADSIGIAPPTFHQHLRKAERKVFDALLGPAAAAD